MVSQCGWWPAQDRPLHWLLRQMIHWLLRQMIHWLLRRMIHWLLRRQECRRSYFCLL
ncbi:MAG: hypothetical protein SPL67_01880 [Prevotella sp.]|nr:hypothetical protein [Prevotella sp.]